MSLDPEIGIPSEPTAAAEVPAPETAPAASQAQPQTQAPRTYSQADMDRAAAWYRKSVQEERARIEREFQQRSAPPQQPDPARDEATQFVRAQFDNYMAPYKQQLLETELDRTIASFAREAPEFGDENTVRDILGIAVEKGLDRRTDLSIAEVLNLAHYHWLRSQPKPDIEAVKKQAKDEAVRGYLATKATTSASQPKPEGMGGATPVASAKPKDWKSADSVAMEIIRKSRAT